MKTYKILIFAGVALCLFWNAIYYSVPAIDLFLLLFSIFFTYDYVKKFDLLRDLASTIVLLSLFLSVVFIATFQMAGNKYSYNDYTLLAPFANRLYFEFIIFSSLFLNMRRGKRQIVHKYKAVPLSERKVKTIFIITFLALTIGFITGSLRMDSMWDAGRIVLSFHLNGIIYVFAQVVAARLFMVIVENQILTKGKVKKNDIIIIILLGLYGSFTSMSKGLMFYYIGLPMLIMYIYYRPKFSVVLRYGAPVMLMLVLLFPIVGAMRSFKDSNMSVTEKIFSARELSNEEKGKDAQYNNSLEATYNRAFMTGSYYMNAYPHLNHSDLLDFSRVPFILLNGGVSFIITHEVDGFPIDYPHNSGSTGVLDALFFGGYGFCYIMMFLIIILASVIDSPKLKDMISIKIMLALLIFDLLNSSILEPFIVPQYWIRLVGVGLAIYVAKKVNFRKELILKY
jgi:hypothetical protein